MANKKKKQHYVPKCYLRSWCFSEKNLIYVYDKETDSMRISNIDEVAQGRFFYDIHPYELLPDTEVIKLLEKGVTWDTNKKSQIIENAFADEIEPPLSEALNKIIVTAENATPWYLNNCFFIGKDDKRTFASFLALQLLRTKSMRDKFKDMANGIEELLCGMGADACTIEKYSISKDDIKQMHLQMMLDPETLRDMTNLFDRLTWILGVNRTNTKFFTTDNPICTYGHVKHPGRSLNGLGSKGVEVFYPISPNLILIMFDGAYHKDTNLHDRWYLEITDSANIDYYNSLLAMIADRMIFSCDNNFELIDEMKCKNPIVFQ